MMMRRRRGLPSFCHGVASTSTVHQPQLHGSSSTAGADAASSSFVTTVPPPSVVGSCVAETDQASDDTGTGGGCDGAPPAAVTLEQMILQLDLEEEEEAARNARRRAAAEEEGRGWCPRRMSCVDGGVLRSARDALSQYPRFSLDGRDAMYRASFSGFYDGVGRRDRPARASVCCAGGEGLVAGPPLACSVGGYEMDLERTLRMPATVAGESVVWCKPGVVARLMGLDAVPVPLRGGLCRRRKMASASGGQQPVVASSARGVRKQRTTTAGQDQELALHREKLFMALHGYDDLVGTTGGRHSYSGSAGGLRSGVGPESPGVLVGAMGADDGDGWESRLHH